jgi:ABC-type phosphate transport system substrate-binding protein
LPPLTSRSDRRELENIMNIRKLAIAIALLACGAAAEAGEVVVIVNKANDNTLDKALVAKIYTGESKVWGNGGGISAYDLPEDNPARASFASEMVGKTQSSLKSLWTQNVFTGKSVPPKSAASDDEVKKAVSANKNAIGYIKASSADDTVKVVVK